MSRTGFLYVFFLCCVPVILCQTADTTGGTTTGITSAGTTGFVSSTTGTTGTTGGDTIYYAQLSSSGPSVSETLPSGSSVIGITFPTGINGTAQYSLASPGDNNYDSPQTGAPSGFSFGGISFFIGITDPTQVTSFPPGTRLKITIQQTTSVDGLQLYLYNKTTQQWEDAVDTCSPPNTTVVDTNTIIFDVCHLTQFATFLQPSPVQTTTGATKPASSSTNDGLLAAVIIVPIVIVAVVVALVAWTLLRKSDRSQDNNTPANSVEMGTKKTATPASQGLTSISTPAKKKDESSSEEEESEESSEEDEDEDEDDDKKKSEESEESDNDNKDKKESSSEEESEESEESESESSASKK